jgi:ferredoxin
MVADPVAPSLANRVHRPDRSCCPAAASEIVGAGRAALSDAITTALGLAANGFRYGQNVLEIKIDRDVCMGSGNCSFWAPGVFDLDDDGIAIVVDPAGAPEDKIVLAAQGCPTQAIAILRDGDKIV